MLKIIFFNLLLKINKLYPSNRLQLRKRFLQIELYFKYETKVNALMAFYKWLVVVVAWLMGLFSLLVTCCDDKCSISKGLLLCSLSIFMIAIAHRHFKQTTTLFKNKKMYVTPDGSLIFTHLKP